MFRKFYGLCVVVLCLNSSADEPLVLEFDFDDLLSISHNIEGFIFPATQNFWGDSKKNINDMSAEALKDQLSATGLVRLNGEVVGFVTEQERLYVDAETNKPMAESMWMFRLNSPGITGFMAVLQHEDPTGVFSLMQQVTSEPEKNWPDEWQLFLSTAGETHIQFASGELEKYQGGLFEEYNGANPSDFSRLGRFRGKIRFVIAAAE